VIVAAHVAGGALAGELARSRTLAIPLGLALHVVVDLTPHRDFESRPFEFACGIVGVLALGLRRGFGDPPTVGAIACSVPDLEHVLPLPRPGGRMLFPSHRWKALHRGGGVSPWLQLAASVAVLAAVLVRR
jgi:hypothetical protein